MKKLFFLPVLGVAALALCSFSPNSSEKDPVISVSKEGKILIEQPDKISTEDYKILAENITNFNANPLADIGYGTCYTVSTANTCRAYNTTYPIETEAKEAVDAVIAKYSN